MSEQTQTIGEIAQQYAEQVDQFIVTDLVGEMSIVCDYAEHWTCPKDPAEWVLHRVRCGCGYGGHALACTPCKDARLMAAADMVLLCGGCGDPVPAREAYTYIEPIGRPR